MTKKHKDEQTQETEQDKEKQESPETESYEGADVKEETIDGLKKSLAEAHDKYVRLYADFENYKKIAARNKEELLKYANEELISDILTVIDHLELALEHAFDNNAGALAEGVSLTLKELKNVLEKHGLVIIEALGKPFDPTVHHAISQIETDDTEENTVVKEFRKGYILRDRVLRAALVGVSTKQRKAQNVEADNDQDQSDTEN